MKDVIEMANKTGKGLEMKQKAEQIGEQIRAAMMDEGEEVGSSVKRLDDFVKSILLRRQEDSVR